MKQSNIDVLKRVTNAYAEVANGPYHAEYKAEWTRAPLWRVFRESALAYHWASVRGGSFVERVEHFRVEKMCIDTMLALGYSASRAVCILNRWCRRIDREISTFMWSPLTRELKASHYGLSLTWDWKWNETTHEYRMGRRDPSNIEAWEVDHAAMNGFGPKFDTPAGAQ